MVRKRNRGLKVLLILPVLLALAGCADLLASSPGSGELVGTWVAKDLPGEPTMTFTDAPYYTEDSKYPLYNGEIEFTGWPIEVFDSDARVPASEVDWSHPRNWTGQWRLRTPGVSVILREDGEGIAEDEQLRTGASMFLYDTLFSFNCVDFYFAVDENVTPTRLCKV